MSGIVSSYAKSLSLLGIAKVIALFYTCSPQRMRISISPYPCQYVPLSALLILAVQVESDIDELLNYRYGSG